MRAPNDLISQLKESSTGRAVGRRVVATLDRRERAGSHLTRATSTSHMWALMRLRLLDEVSETELNELSCHITVTDYPRRHCLLLDEQAGHVWLVLKGSIKLSRLGFLGRRFVEALLETGDIFGRLSSNGELASYEAQMLEPTQIATVPREHFERLLRRHPDLSFSVVQELENRQRRLVRRIEALVFKDVRARVAEMLLELAQETNAPCQHGFAVDVRITQQDLADLVGASRQMVNRVLGELSRSLYIHRMGRVICILHRDRLERFVDDVSTG